MDGFGDRLCVCQSVLLTLAVHAAEPRRQLQGGQPSSCLLNAQHQGGWGRGGQGLVERGRGEVPSRVEFGPGAVCVFLFFFGGDWLRIVRMDGSETQTRPHPSMYPPPPT